MRSRILERWHRMEMGWKSEGEEGFLVLGRGVTCESFQADGKVKEFRERLKRSRMMGKITGKLSMTRRRFRLSGPVELKVHVKSALRRMTGVMWRK